MAIEEREATEYTLHVENLLQECGQAHNAHLRANLDKDLKMMETSDHGKWTKRE